MHNVAPPPLWLKNTKMEVKIVSVDHIKPSSSTPSHLRTFKLCLLDQLIPSPNAPLILFYPPTNDDVSDKLESLKKSLSETLTRFYPLAGKIKGDFSIDCNDEGAYFVEVKVDSSLTGFLNQPDYLVLLQKLLPCDLNLVAVKDDDNNNNHVTNIQVNVFECGGIAIGLCISHKILDGIALSAFIRSWATLARDSDEEGITESKILVNTASTLFPANDEELWLRDTSLAMFGSFFTKGKCVTKRFVFDASAITALKSKASSSSSAVVKNPTRVEAVSAFIWRCIIAASKEENGGVLRASLMTHLVNLRRRTAPFLSENCLGNLLWVASAKAPAGDDDDDVAELCDLVGLLRESFSKIDSEFVKRMSGEKGRRLMEESLKGIIEERGGLSRDGHEEEVNQVGFSSWCKFGFYEADFGWGKPAWVTSYGIRGSVFMRLVILVDTRLGDGIEAWVTLDERHMAIMETNTQLRQLAKVDPSPF